MPSDFLPAWPPLIRHLLWSRGFRDSAEAEQYLEPRLADLPLPNSKMKDLDLALQALMEARERKHPVVIFGDFDVDGATSTSLLFQSLRDLGWNCSYFVPHRIAEGYGITKKAAERLLQDYPKVKLILSCDCGISSHEGIEYLRSKSRKVIVTDHHEVPSKRVSAEAVLNPKQADCFYPDKKLAGVGVAFLLVMALRRALEARDYALRPLLDLVALGTVCDLAELTGANRILVKSGLEVLNQFNRPGLRGIQKVAEIQSKQLKAKDLGFLLGPRLNAVGRVGDPRLGIDCLLTSPDREAEALAEQLEAHNNRRRQMQESQTELALELAEEALRNSPTQSALLVKHADFHLGIVGLIASRIAEKFKRPACVLTNLNDEHALVNFQILESSDRPMIWKGSLRAPKPYHLAKALSRTNDLMGLRLLSFGGHAQAAGVSIREEDLLAFEGAFQGAVAAQQTMNLSEDYELELNSIEGLDEILELLEPIGQANPSPRFLLRRFRLREVRIMKERHLKLLGSFKGRNWSVLQFRSPWVTMMSNLDLQGGGAVELDIIAELYENVWNSRTSLEFELKDIQGIEEDGRSIYEYKKSTNEISAGPLT